MGYSLQALFYVMTWVKAETKHNKEDKSENVATLYERMLGDFEENTKTDIENKISVE
jgi:hypothetical protein